MKCPVCSESQLAIIDRQGAEIGYCLDCRGVWLNQTSIDKLIDSKRPKVTLPIPDNFFDQKFDVSYFKTKSQRCIASEV